MTMAAVHNVREKFRDKGVEVLSVDQAEDREHVKAFVEKNGLKLWVLLDSDVSVSRTYCVVGIPTLFVIDKQGIVRIRVVGYRPDLEYALTNYLNEEILKEKTSEEAKK
jgi:cytochrome c biogenesis protein CcmG, thiol:disulfide interchange protein DsbE